jgi:hypothetical protein
VSVNMKKIEHFEDFGIDVIILTWQTMYVYGNIKARSCNHCYSGKTIGITYSECVFVALVFQHAMRMPHFIMCDCSALKYFSTFIS